MVRRSGRLAIPAMVLALVVAACGDDETATTASSSTTGAAPITTAAWGEAVAPGSEAMLEGSRVLLREDFQDGDTAGWQIDSGWYTLANGERRMLGAGGEAWAWYEAGRDWSRYGVRLAFLAQEGTLGVSLAVGAEGRYLVHFSPEGVYLLKDAPYGAFASLGSAQPAALGSAHVAAIGADGGHLQVYLDGVLLIDAIDPAPLAGGSIGLGAAGGSSVVVDNIVVASLGGPLPHIQPAVEPADELLPGDLGDGAPGEGESLEGGGGADDGLPNLVISGVSYPMQIRLGQAFEVLLSARNVGGVAVGSFMLAFLSDGEQCEAAVDGLAVGAETTVSCRFPGYAANGSETYEWTAAADSAGDIDEGAFEDDNLAVGTISIADGEEEVLPNLVIGWAERVPTTPAPGEVVTVQVGVAQSNPAWTGPLPDLEFRVFFEDGGVACGGTVPAGEDSGSCDLPPFETPGEYWLRLAVDEPGVLAESNEEDNSLFVPLQVSAVGLVELPNLYFGRVTLDATVLSAGEHFTMAVTVGSGDPNTPVGAYTIRLLIDGVVVCSADVDFTEGVLPCAIPGVASGTRQWEAYIDADNDVIESNEGDNAGFGHFWVND